MTYNIISTGSQESLIEEWRDIKDFEGYYQISNFGRLKSFKQYKNGKILKLTNSKNSYFSVVLCTNNYRKSTRIHRLVAEHFLFNLCDYKLVNHIDGNKQNNRLDNLEWCSPSQNVKHSMSMNENHIKPMNYYNQFIRPKRIIQLDFRGNILNAFANAKEASDITKVCSRNILQVCNKTPFDKNNNTRKQAGGFIWKFESEVISLI